MELTKGMLLAYELHSWLQSAVYDIADDDIHADKLYEDEDTLSDLMRDRIFEGTKHGEDTEMAKDCCNKLLVIGHTPLKKVVREYMKSHNIEELNNA